MKLTLSTLASPAWTLRTIAKACQDAGIMGVDFRGLGSELDITQLPEFASALPATLELLRQHHLQMPCLNTSITLVTPAISKWELMLAEARRYAELAARTQTRFLRIFGGSVPAGMSREDAVDLASNHLRELVTLCRPLGCRPLLETHDAWVVHTEIEKLFAGVDRDEAGVLWDLEHPWRAGEAPALTAEKLGPRIAHVHIKDTVRKQGKSMPVLLGEGELPLEECQSALASIGYDGWICLETEKRWHADGPEPEISVPQFGKYMRERWGYLQSASEKI